MDSREGLVALNMVEGVGPIRVRQLLEQFGDAASILKASRSQLAAVRGIGDDTAEAISKWETTVPLAAEHPELLKQIYDPPIVLYVKGSLTAKDKNAVALVGSRMTTHYGIETARRLAYQLGYVGVT